MRSYRICTLALACMLMVLLPSYVASKGQLHAETSAEGGNEVATQSSENSKEVWENTRSTAPEGIAPDADENMASRIPSAKQEEAQNNIIYLQIGGRLLTATLVENSSTAALKELLAKGPAVLDMQDYGSMEKVGELGASLPTNNEQITTGYGDLILYQGSSFVIYYDSNTWSLTRLGKIDGVSQQELKEILGSGDVSVTLSLHQIAMN